MTQANVGPVRAPEFSDNVTWLQGRTDLFHEAAPSARIVELDTSNHTIFVAKEDETVSCGSVAGRVQ